MLEIETLSKVYPLPSPWLRPLIRVAARTPVLALDDVSFGVSAGEIVGLVGPNGAGKTTLIRIISTLLEPTSGRVMVAGHDVESEPMEARRRLGLVLEGERGLYARLTGAQNLEFFGVMAGLSPVRARQRATELMDQLGLTGRDKLVFGYSSGMKVRLSLARALLTAPPLLVLDEPTRSLDPVATTEVGRTLRQMAGETGQAVLLSSHQLEEVVAVCDQVAILIAGELRYLGRARDLQLETASPASGLANFLLEQTRINPADV